MSQSRIILIIDDDPDDVAFFCEAINEIDDSLKCLSASGGEEAILLLEGKNIVPEYIFLDLNMPNMNGRQCLQQIKEHFNLSSIPIVIYTTSSSQDDIDDFKDMRSVYFLTKPHKFEDLKTAIQIIFGARVNA
jgi:CheY-like chemotaxis protein